MTTGQLLRQARRDAGLTQAELAARAGTSQPVISAYEHDQREPTVPTLRRLLAAAGARLELRAVSDRGGRQLREQVWRSRAVRLVDALLLADAIPTRRRGALRFPRISSWPNG